VKLSALIDLIRIEKELNGKKTWFSRAVNGIT